MMLFSGVLALAGTISLMLFVDIEQHSPPPLEASPTQLIPSPVVIYFPECANRGMQIRLLRDESVCKFIPRLNSRKDVLNFLAGRPKPFLDLEMTDIDVEGLDADDFDKLQEILRDGSNIRRFSASSGPERNCTLPPEIIQCIFDLRPLEGLRISHINDFTCPNNCEISMTNLSVCRCENFNPGGIFTAGSLKSFFLESVILADQNCPTNFSRLERLDVDVSTIAKNGEFFNRAKFPYLHTLQLSTSGFGSLAANELVLVDGWLSSIMPEIENLTFIHSSDSDNKDFDYAKIFKSCVSCKSMWFCGSSRYPDKLYKFANAIVTAKENGQLLALQTLALPAGSLSSGEAWVATLKQIPGLTIEES